MRVRFRCAECGRSFWVRENMDLFKIKCCPYCSSRSISTDFNLSTVMKDPDIVDEFLRSGKTKKLINY